MLFDLPRWSYAQCLPYFKASETSDRGANDWRGGDGPLGVTRGSLDNPLYDAFIEAGGQSGQGQSDDLNAYKPEGRAGLCSCHVLADPIDDLFAEYEAAGLVFEQELNVQAWGLNDFVLRDPDGKRLEIGGPIREGEQG